MAKKLKQIHINIGIVFIIILLFAVVYFSSAYKRFGVTEEDFIKNPIISPEHPLAYKTEFCASKLTDLVQEIHFLEKQIQEQEKIAIKYNEEFSGEEETIIQIEQREIPAIRKEFEKYRSLCDQFDDNPTPELCAQFLKEAEHKLELAQENTKAAESKGILERLELSSQDLRKAKRIYEGLQTKCESVE